MASEPNVSEISSLFERFFTNRDSSLSLFLPFIFGFSTSSSRRNTEDPHHETENSSNPHRQRVILINPFTQGMIMIDGGELSFDALFREMGTKNGRPPATKEAIEAMESVEIGEGEDDGECVICLEEWEIGGVVKEMPCKHRFHGDCIEKWLGIHGCCPVCRYEMPKEEVVGKKDDDDDEDEGEERRRRGQVWVSFSFRNGDQIQNQGAVSGGDSVDSSSSTQRGDGDGEVES